jgi:hypothetical protein
LAGILTGQGQLGDETRGLFKRFLAISSLNFGPDGSNTAASNSNLGSYNCQIAKIQTTVDLRQKQLLLAKAYFEESHRICFKIYGPTHTETVDAASQLTDVSSELSRISQA